MFFDKFEVVKLCHFVTGAPWRYGSGWTIHTHVHIERHLDFYATFTEFFPTLPITIDSNDGSIISVCDAVPTLKSFFAMLFISLHRTLPLYA